MTSDEWLKTGTVVAENKKSATYWWLAYKLEVNQNRDKCIKNFFKCLRKNQK